ncbi:hypothetical protein [Komagataeibacter swingsii]|uniref:hypothetical protein n=1 Tax=Komagataeibacter swingsii TaxID=215220 RepID=UPI001C400EB8|nr:hypothetical protein [Komagataeibacter swingsii]
MTPVHAGMDIQRNNPWHFHGNHSTLLEKCYHDGACDGRARRGLLKWKILSVPERHEHQIRHARCRSGIENIWLHGPYPMVEICH